VIKAVLFDLDGTLLDSAPDLVATLNYLRAGLGLTAMPVEDLRHFVSRGAIGLIKAGMPPCDDETLGLWQNSFLDHYRENCFNLSRPFAGIDPLLVELADREIPWGVVTNKMEFLTIPILKQAGWSSSVSAVICGDTVSQSKPHPDPVFAACSSIGVDPANTLMIGDDLRDIEAGKRAGCQTAFALYGYADEQRQYELAPETALINDPEEVLGLLG